MMKRYSFALLLIAAVFFSLCIAGTSSATDRGGCMTCHRYPGLIKHDKEDIIKVLHIDEEKHLASSHGKTDCKQCHPNTVQIPHTGMTEVECTTHCHFEDKDKIDSLDRATLSDFHKEQRFAITRLDDETSCRVCHSLYPHSQNNKVRALVNMHTGFMLCEVCHLIKNNEDNLTYDWKEPEEFTFTGEPYGTHKKEEVESKHTSASIITRMLHIFSKKGNQKDTADTRYVISRIAVYKKEGVNKTLFINQTDNEKARAYLKKEHSMGGSEKEKEMKFFHRQIARKEISVACDECHSDTGILDFRELGFNAKRTKDLQYMNIKGLVKKYDTFYIPNLFGPQD